MKIFWSWQSDTPGKIGRHFIRKALDDAVEELKRDLSLDEPKEREAIEDLHVDQDRQGLPGSIDLLPEILKKIDASGIVVADVTPVGAVDSEGDGEAKPKKRLINSNVAIELGYAYRALTGSYVLLVMNRHFGKHEDLPFDLRHKGGTLSFNLAPNATADDIKYAGKALAKDLGTAIKLCLTARLAAVGTASPVPGLVAIGPNIICEGDILGFDRSEWKLHLRNFVVGDVASLISFVEEFEHLDKVERYVLLGALGDGRCLSGPPSLIKDGAGYVASCSIEPSFPRIEAQAMPSTLATSPQTNDIFIDKGQLARASGVAAIPEIFRSTLSLIKGESPFHLQAGSRLQEYYWKFDKDTRRENFLKLEIIRQAAIPYSGPGKEAEHTPLWCVERVQSVKILADDPVEGRVVLALELDIKGLGRVEQKVSIIMPPAETVAELSHKGTSVGLFQPGKRPDFKPLVEKTAAKPNRNLKRLSVITKRWPPTGLELEIRYEPESQHIGLSARVSLLEPLDGALKPGVPVHNPAPTMRGYVRYELGRKFIEGVGTVKLNPDLRAYKSTVMGVMFVFPSEDAGESLKLAKVRIEIITDAHETLLAHELTVSPM